MPVNKQKASYGTKVEQKLRNEIEDEMRNKYASNGSLGGSASYETKEVAKPREDATLSPRALRDFFRSVIHYSEPIEAKTKPKPSVPIVPSVPKQLTATELLQQSYNEMKRLRQQEKQEKINKFRASMF